MPKPMPAVKFREAVLRRDGDRCVACGNADAQLEVHHIIPQRIAPHLARDFVNVVTLCRGCHSAAEKTRRRGLPIRATATGEVRVTFKIDATLWSDLNAVMPTGKSRGVWLVEMINREITRLTAQKIKQYQRLQDKEVSANAR